MIVSPAVLLRALPLAGAVLLVGLFYRWESRLTGGRFTPHRDLDGYYNQLGRAFAAGQLHLQAKPAPELLALANPWDPRQNEPWRMHDAVLYNRRYYLYHGAVPALILFAPWRILTGFDLPQHFGLWLLVFAGFLFWCGALVRVRGPDRTGALMILAIGLCSGIPYLLNRIDVYEIAIGGAFLCLGAGVFFLAGRQLMLAGLCFGLAVGCRPHLGLVGLAGFVLLLAERRPPHQLARFAAPMATCLALIALYNFARFGNPFEFGVRYLLAGETNQQGVRLAAENIPPGLYYYLWNPVGVDMVFPWFSMVRHLPQGLFHYPADYFLENTAGLFFFAPVTLLAVRASGLARAMALAGLGILFFDMGTGFTTQRYFVDFVPLLVFAAAASCSGRGVGVLFALAAIYGALVNMALGIEGPFWDYPQKRPDSYLRLARIFSPLTAHRPVANPPVDILLRETAGPMPDGIRQPLISMGREVLGYVLYIEHAGGKVRVISKTNGSTVVCSEALPETSINTIHFTSQFASPAESRSVRISVNGAVPTEHPTGLLITAPSQIRVGANNAFLHFTIPKFAGQIETLQVQIPR